MWCALASLSGSLASLSCSQAPVSCLQLATVGSGAMVTTKNPTGCCGLSTTTKTFVFCGDGAGHQGPRCPWQRSSRWTGQALRAPRGVVSGRHKVRAVPASAQATNPHKQATNALARSCHHELPAQHSQENFQSLPVSISSLWIRSSSPTVRPYPGNAAHTGGERGLKVSCTCVPVPISSPLESESPRQSSSWRITNRITS